MYDAILVPTDGSLTAQRAVEHATKRAQKDGADLHALRVVDQGSPGPVNITQWSRWDEVAEELHDQAREDLAKALEPAEEAGIAVHKAVLDHEGVADGILSYADEHDVDVVMMGTHGRSGIERFLLGSVAERVVRKAHLPMLLVPPERISQ